MRLAGSASGLRAAQTSVPSSAFPGDLQIELRRARVRHPRFGSGQILAVEPVAGDAILLIEFSSGEQKRMLARMAKLEKVLV